ncbi:MAG: ABC transporter substrate-binding protein [Candidatus Methylarchaceae archaeon HK02M2]|nr:ABC transporter substrate-binding protein [Candidatus Methylarchaceae archaeon HK02M2]
MKFPVKKTTIILTTIFVFTIITSYGIYHLLSSGYMSNSTVTILDGEGRKITINHPVERVVSLASSVSEIFCTLNASDMLYAVDQYSTFPPYLKEKMDNVDNFNVGSGATPSIETIVYCDPDIVFAWPYCTVIDEIEDRGIPVYIVKYPDDVFDIIDLIKTVGYITGKEDRADEISNVMMGYVKMVENRTKETEQKPLVYFELNEPGNTGNGSTIGGSLIKFSGGVNIAENSTLKYLKMNNEYIISTNPDIIIKFYYGIETNEEEMNQLKEDIMNRPGWSVINAVKNDKVFIINYAECSTSPRLVIGLVRYAKWIHNELFTDIDADVVAEYVYTNIYGLKT